MHNHILKLHLLYSIILTLNSKLRDKPFFYPWPIGRRSETARTTTSSPNVSKTKELIVDYRKRMDEHALIHINRAVVELVESSSSSVSTSLKANLCLLRICDPEGLT